MGLEWGIEGNRIFIRTDAGQVRYPSAHEVFAAAFLDQPSRGTIVEFHKITESIPWLSFSRYTAESALLLTGSISSEITIKYGLQVDGKFVPISLGQDQVIVAEKWFPIDVEVIAELHDCLDHLGIHLNQPLTYRQVLQLKRSVGDVAHIFDDIITDPTLFSDSEIGNTVIPGLCAELYPYQAEGVKFLQTIASKGLGCILADEMGLGKTLQIIALLLSEKNANRIPSLVVAPATLLENWRREILAFAPSLSTLVHTGSSRTGDPSTFKLFDVVITSYDLAVRDEELFNTIIWDLLVLDEAQNIKNSETQRAISVKRIRRHVSIAVTGTPVENRLTDLWSLSDFVLSGLLGSQNGFENKFDNTLNDAAALAKLVAPIILRRNIADVAQDLPNRIDILQPIVMSEQVAAAYEQARTAILEQYGPSGAMVATTHLRMICAHPSIVNTWTNIVIADMPKFQRLLEILDEIFERQEKALIFTSFRLMADLIMKQLKSKWPQGDFSCIDGRVPVESRQAMVDQFSAFSGYGAMVLNPKAAGTGLNITAANHVIHYNPEWNPALTAQSTARAFRRRQMRPVTVHHLYFIGSVEDVIVSRAEFKSQLAGEALSKAHVPVDDADLNTLALSISPLVQ